MTREEVERDIEQNLGLVPRWFDAVPDAVIENEWATMRDFQLSDQTAIPPKYKELMGLAVSGATRCSYCAYFHTEAARLFGATEEEIAEAAMMSKQTMGWSSYLNAMKLDYDEFCAEFDRVVAHVGKQMEAAG
jgi:AhpD family alkylhydroperoxidase